MQASSWISRLNSVQVNIHERVDQDNVVEELTNILKDAASLKIQGLNLLSVLLVWVESEVTFTAVVMTICLIHHGCLFPFSVRELPPIELELKKACCRAKALQVM